MQTFYYTSHYNTGFNQVDPTVLRVMQIANSDPVVSAFCRSQNITDANVLYQHLLAKGKEMYLAKLKAYTEDQLRQLTPPLLRDYDPEKTRVKHRVLKDAACFDPFHIRDEDGIRWQCTCGAIIFNATPDDVSAFRELGHNRTYSHACVDRDKLEPIKPRTSVRIRFDVTETDIIDGVATPKPGDADGKVDNT